MTSDLSGALSLSWVEDYHGAGFGRMDLVARSTRGFCGSGGAWVNGSDLQLLASAASAYPLDPQNLPAIEGGLINPETGLFQCLASLRVQQVTSAGQLVMVVFLADDATDRRQGPFGFEQSATVVLPTTHQRLNEFADAIRSILSDRSGSTSIGEEVLR